MSFKAMVARDNQAVFSNPKEFAELRLIKYEGVTYEGEDGQGIPVVITKAREKDRRQLKDDYGEGIFRVNVTLHVDVRYLNGIVPKKGQKLYISETQDFFQTYYIVTSANTMGMVTLELEAKDE